MHPDSTPSRRYTWLRRTRLLGEGLVLGGVQILLLVTTVPVFTEHPPVPLPLVLVGALSVCSYLIVTVSEGFLAAARTGEIGAGVDAAWLVAGGSVLPIAFPSGVLVVLKYAGILPAQNGMAGLQIIILLSSILLDGLWALLVSTLGGWMGGVVGHLSAPRGNQSRLHPAHQPPPGRAPEGS